MVLVVTSDETREMEMVAPEGESETERCSTMYGESGVLILIFVAGLLANAPVLILYFRSKHIRSITDKFLLNLLLADIASIILLFPGILFSFFKTSSDTGFVSSHEQLFSQITSSQLQGNDIIISNNNATHRESSHPARAEEGLGFTSAIGSWHWNCALNNGILAGLAAASVLAALEIAMERYLAVVKPLHYHKFLTTPSILVTSLVGGIISLATAIIGTIEPNFSVFPHCFKVHNEALHTTRSSREISLNYETASEQNNHEGPMWGFHKSKNGSIDISNRIPSLTPTSSDLIWSLYSLTNVTFLFFIPVILMIYIYTKIWLEARRQKIKIANQYKPYFLPVPSEHVVTNESKGKKEKGGSILPIIVRFRLMNRLKATRLDRAGRVAVVALVVTILCWSPYYFLKASQAIQIIMTMYGYESHQSYFTFNTSTWSWSTTTLPLLFASLHPLLSPLFYAYRYKRMRTEIYKWVSSLCVPYDQSNPNNRLDGKTRSTINTNSYSGGTPCIRQGIITQQLHPRHQTAKGDSSLLEVGVDKNEVELAVNQPEEIVLESKSHSNGQIIASPYNHNHVNGMMVVDPYQNEEGIKLPGSHICINVFPSDNNETMGGINGALETDLEDNDHDHDRCGNDSEHDGQPPTSSSPNYIVGGIVRVERSVGNFFNYLNVWVSSYSRRWLQHRESVTSTASFITLLSSKYHNKTHTVANV